MTQEEINEILLSKNLDDFYLAIIEKKQGTLTNEEYNEITSKEKEYYGDTKEDVLNLINKIQNENILKKFKDDLLKLMYSLGQIRYSAVLTMIDNKVYNIGVAKFENSDRNKIIHYDKFTNYYNDSNARLKLFTPKEEKMIIQNSVLLDVDDESNIFAYEKEHIHQKEKEDLTNNFINEFNKKNKILK